jgi:hypothetical protein
MPYTTPYYQRLQSRRRMLPDSFGGLPDKTGSDFMSATGVRQFITPTIKPTGGGGGLPPAEGTDSFLKDADYTGALSGALGLFGQYENMSHQSLGLDQYKPQLQTSATGQPTYQFGQLSNAANSARPQGAQAGEIASGALQGAAAGASIGGPVGAGVGAIVGTGVSLVGGARRKRKQRREQQAALQKVQAGQKEYNTAYDQFYTNNLAMQDYQDRSNTSNQLYNLYK